MANFVLSSSRSINKAESLTFIDYISLNGLIYGLFVYKANNNYNIFKSIKLLKKR